MPTDFRSAPHAIGPRGDARLNLYLLLAYAASRGLSRLSKRIGTIISLACLKTRLLDCGRAALRGTPCASVSYLPSFFGPANPGPSVPVLYCVLYSLVAGRCQAFLAENRFFSTDAPLDPSAVPGDFSAYGGQATLHFLREQGSNRLFSRKGSSCMRSALRNCLGRLRERMDGRIA